MRLRLFLAVLLLLLLVGRFLPGPLAWGFNHLAYLPLWFYLLWVPAAALLFWPKLQDACAEALRERVPRLLFARAPLIGILVAGGIFALLRERSFFMGDGYLVGELQEQGVRFRAFDSLDYLLHYQTYQLLKRSFAAISSFTVYRAASVVAGMGAVLLYWALIRRLSWEPWRKAVLYLLLFLIGPVALYFGYVESYTFLFLWLTAFMLTGLLVLERRAPLWLAATFFGMGLAFHLTAVATGPALLFLALRAPVRPAARRWLEAILPPAALFALAVGLHLAEGYNGFWFRKEFLEAKNTKSLWIPWASGRGLFSTYLWKDQFNLLMITAPACVAVLLARAGTLRQRLKESPVLFLLSQMAPIAILSIVLDRKLGGARDWDLLAAHSAGLILLAAFLLPKGPAAPEPAAPRGKRNAHPRPDSSVAVLLGAALLITFPWILLLHMEPRSIARFVSVAADFPLFPRAYAYEEVGKYYRKAEDLARAQVMYEKCVESYPGNARFHVLLGSIYYMRQNLESAEKCYSDAMKIDPSNFMALEMLGKIALQRQKWDEALADFQRLTELRGQVAASWELVAYAAARANQPEEVVRGFRKAMQLDPKLDHWHDLGTALLNLGRPDEAVPAFREAVRRNPTPACKLGLGWALLGRATEEIREGKPGAAESLKEAEGVAQALLRESGNRDANAEALAQKIQALKRWTRP